MRLSSDLLKKVQGPARREGEGSTNGTGAEEDEVDRVEDGTLLV